MAIHTLQVTLGASATPLTTTDTFARWVVIQNNAANSMRVGDSTVTSTKGILLASGSPGGSVTLPEEHTPSTTYDLSQIYILGTNTQLADVLWAD